MTVPRFRLDGTLYVTPLRQGDLSNLCGLYSILNAVQLACWRVPPTREQLCELLKFGIRHLTKRRLLAQVMTSGMKKEEWIDLSAALVDHWNGLMGTSLALKPVRLGSRSSGTSKAGAAIKKLKDTLSEGHPVMCGFGGALDHFTVLAGYSEQRLTLFDSSGFRWLEQRSIGSSEECGKRHWLYTGSARALVDEW